MNLDWSTYLFIGMAAGWFFTLIWVFHLRDDLATIRRDRNEYRDTVTNTSAQNLAMQARLRALEGSIGRQNETIRNANNALGEINTNIGSVRWNELAEAANEWDNKKRRERLQAEAEANQPVSTRFEKLLDE